MILKSLSEKWFYLILHWRLFLVISCCQFIVCSDVTQAVTKSIAGQYNIMFISFVFAEIFLRLFICLLCAVPWNAHNAPSSRVSLYHCIWNLKSNRHLTPPSLRLLRPQWAINMPALLVLPLMSHQGYSMLTWVLKLYLNNIKSSSEGPKPKHSIQNPK